MFSLQPIQLLTAAINEPGVFLLDSASGNREQARYSYLGINPVKIIKAKSFDQLRQLKTTLPAVGFIGYDGHMQFALYDALCCLDHQRKSLTIKTFGLSKNVKRLKELIKKAQSGDRSQAPVTPQASLKLTPSMTQREFKKAVTTTLKHIHDGDIYQLNLTYQREGTINKSIKPQDALAVYEALRQASPTHLSAFIKTGDQFILCSSPERFLSLKKNIATLCPMKGTRPRGKNKDQDTRNRRELLINPKERAELLMVTDLARNDLGRVCQTGSVKVKALRSIESYAHVFQATATVQGKLRKDKTIIDLLEATFPSGSVTGCPKLSAMAIIDKLEKTKRGLYTGALGYFNLNDEADFNVMIRTIFMRGKTIKFNVGSGIVADSKPQAEYDETVLKSQGMIKAIQLGLNVNIL